MADTEHPDVMKKILDDDDDDKEEAKQGAESLVQTASRMNGGKVRDVASR